MKPNVIILVLDCVRHDKIGASGSGDVATHYLDRIASDGAVFTQAVCHAPFTTPSITTILSGLYPFNHGIRLLIGQRLNHNVPQASTIFSEAGYTTAGFPSIFLLDGDLGFNSGFDLYDDHIQTERKGFRGPWRPGKLTNEAVFKFLDNRSRKKPFFAYIHYFDAHDYNPGQKDSLSKYKTKVSEVDFLIGQLVEELKEDGTWDETVIAITGDHGDGFGEHGIHNHGKALYDEVLRVPLVIRSPGNISPGSVISQQVRHVDILPTLLELAGVKGRTDKRSSIPRMDGTSLVPALEGNDLDLQSYSETSPVQLFTGGSLETKEFRGPEIVSLRTSRYKYIKKTDSFDEKAYRKMLKRGKMSIFTRIVNAGTLPNRFDKEELYDLKEDPREKRNLAEKYPNICTEFRASLNKLLTDARTSSKYRIDVGSSEDEQIMREKLKGLGYME